jgi:hypothetical protein
MNGKRHMNEAESLLKKLKALKEDGLHHRIGELGGMIDDHIVRGLSQVGPKSFHRLRRMAISRNKLLRPPETEKEVPLLKEQANTRLAIATGLALGEEETQDDAKQEEKTDSGTTCEVHPETQEDGHSWPGAGLPKVPEELEKEFVEAAKAIEGRGGTNMEGVSDDRDLHVTPEMIAKIKRDIHFPKTSGSENVKIEDPNITRERSEQVGEFLEDQPESKNPALDFIKGLKK